MEYIRTPLEMQALLWQWSLGRKQGIKLLSSLSPKLFFTWSADKCLILQKRLCSFFLSKMPFSFVVKSWEHVEELLRAVGGITEHTENENSISSWRQSATIREESGYFPVFTVSEPETGKGELRPGVTSFGPKAPFTFMEKNWTKSFFAIFSMVLFQFNIS